MFASDGSFEAKDVAAGLFALFGTFAGALLAFRLEENREKAREVRAQKTALNRALLVLGFHHNEIRTFRNLIAPHRTDIELAFNLPASQPPEQIDMRQKFDELDFLLDSSAPQVLFDLIIEQERFDQALQAVRQRNEFYVREVQPVFAAQGLNNRRVSMAELKSKLGEYLFGGALQGAETIREHIEGSNESIPVAVEKLRKVAKELFPDEKFLMFEKVLLPHEIAEEAAKAKAATETSGFGATPARVEE
ncbi:hypothetical protein EER27_05690 [Lysobacter psychrotolerans]|uniref:Uncharacterized protein n=1 Tax=Montanilutibacter psychrotolerans TaxID=1327343 RepID=A0A3M8SV83_9GAMM|nr:hypothetical protein EER27_05690 [Lysobacter psychrotolerans]